MYLHLPDSIAGRWQDRDFYAVCPIAQMNDGDAVIECFFGRVAQKWNFSANCRLRAPSDVLITPKLLPPNTSVT